jgi:thiamine monophosphate synthase
MISEMYKKNLITDDEKRILKCISYIEIEKAISDDLQIFQILDKYERTKNEEELGSNLINLVKGKGFNLTLNEVSSKLR